MFKVTTNHTSTYADDDNTYQGRAQVEWCETSFVERQKVLRSTQWHAIENCETRIMDYGKLALDSMMGEILTTCEKIRCINVNGEEWMDKHHEWTGPMMTHESVCEKCVPFGRLS